MGKLLTDEFGCRICKKCGLIDAPMFFMENLNQCKECHAKYQKDFYNTPVQIAKRKSRDTMEAQKKWRSKNKVKLKESKRAWAEKNREHINAYTKKYYLEHGRNQRQSTEQKEARNKKLRENYDPVKQRVTYLKNKLAKIREDKK